MKSYWMELRYSPLRWWLPVLVIVDLATLFGRSSAWIGEWPQTSVAAQISAFYFAPMLAAAAAWSAGRANRNGTTTLLDGAARPGWRVELTPLAASVTFGLIAYGAGVVVAVAVTLPKTTPGFLWPGYVAIGISLLVGFAAIGHLVGRWWNAPFAAPAVSGLGTFLVIAWFGSPGQLGLFVLNGAPFYGPSGTAVVARIGIAACALAAAVVVPRPGVRHVEKRWLSRSTATTQACLCAALVVSLFGMHSAGPIQVTRGAPPRQACTDGVPAICFWPDDAKYLPAAQSMSVRLGQLAGFGFAVPGKFFEQGLRGMQTEHQDFYVLDGSLWDPSITMAGQVVDSAMPRDCLRDGSHKAIPEAVIREVGELNMWATIRTFGSGRPADMHGGPQGVDLPAMAQEAALPQDQQHSWVAQHLEDIRHAFCE